MGTQFATGSSENYSIGGMRLFFDELLTNGNYRGQYYLGNIVSASISSELDELEHFTAQSGTNLRDRSIIREVSFSIPFTFDEPAVDNLNFLFFGGETVDDVAADVTPGSTENIFASETAVFLTGFRNSDAASIEVKDITDTTTYTLGTDYTVKQVGKMAGISIPTGSTITAGDELIINYTNDMSAGKKVTVGAKIERSGKALIQAVSDTGNEFEWRIPKASLKPDGEFGYSAEDWSEFSGIIEVLADTSQTNQFGEVISWGTNADL